MSTLSYQPKQSPNSFAYPVMSPVEMFVEKYSEEHLKIGEGTALFDAIFQFHQKYLNNELYKSIEAKPYSLEKQYLYNDSKLSATVKHEIKTLISEVNATVRPPIITPQEGFKASYFVIAIKNPRLILLQNDPDLEALVEWDIIVYIKLGRVLDPLQPNEKEFISKVLTTGIVTTNANVTLSTKSNIWQVQANLYFPLTQINIEAPQGLFKDLLTSFLPSKDMTTSVTDCFLQLLSDQAAITPRMCLGGKMLPGEKLLGISGFHVNYVIRAYKKSAVLCLCIDTSLKSKGGGLGLIMPFLEGSQFAYYFSEKVAQAVVSSRWQRNSVMKSFTKETKIPLKDPDNKKKTVYGKAMVKWEWMKVPNVHIAISPGSDGALRLKSVGNLTLLKIWNHKNEKVEKEDYPDLFKTVQRGLAVDVKMFETKKTKTAYPIINHNMQLIEPLYIPVASNQSITVESGLISGAIYGVIIRGKFSN